MKALSPEQYAGLLEQYVAMLDHQIAALQPSGWPVPALAESYAGAEAHAALGDLWESSIKELMYQAWQARQARKWEEKKLAHMYL